MRSLSAQMIALIVGAVVIVVGLALLVHSCDVRRSKGVQSRVNAGQQGAFENSSADAVSTISNSAANEAASEELTRKNERDIRAAEGANAPVADTATRAGKAAYCRREAYRNKPYCKEPTK